MVVVYAVMCLCAAGRRVRGDVARGYAELGIIG